MFHKAIHNSCPTNPFDLMEFNLLHAFEIFACGADGFACGVAPRFPGIDLVEKQNIMK